MYFCFKITTKISKRELMMYMKLKFTDELEYEEMKRAMGFVWWSMKKTQSGIWIIVDGRELDMFVKGKTIDNSCLYIR